MADKRYRERGVAGQDLWKGCEVAHVLRDHHRGRKLEGSSRMIRRSGARPPAETAITTIAAASSSTTLAFGMLRPTSDIAKNYVRFPT